MAYGYAKLIESTGEAVKNGADAALTLSEVRRREMENCKKSLETWLEVEKINRAARAAARGRPLTPADYMAARRFLESVAYELRMPATEGEEMRTAAIIRPLR
jgi:hypothetical protein